jgi:hypothetical protein
MTKRPAKKSAGKPAPAPARKAGKKARQEPAHPKLAIARKAGFTDPDAAFAAWKAGTPLGAIAKERKLRRRVVKFTFIELAGGKNAFNELRAEGAGGRAFGGKAGGGKRKTKEERKPDDSKLKKLTSSADWKIRREYRPVVVKLEGGKKNDPSLPTHMRWRELMLAVYVSPKGNEYVRAEEFEPADLLLTVPNLPGTVVRLRKYKEAAAVKKAKAADDLVTRGLKARKVKKQQKRKHKKTIAKHAAKK